jgi:hypothetical protein
MRNFDVVGESPHETVIVDACLDVNGASVALRKAILSGDSAWCFRGVGTVVFQRTAAAVIHALSLGQLLLFLKFHYSNGYFGGFAAYAILKAR